MKILLNNEIPKRTHFLLRLKISGFLQHPSSKKCPPPNVLFVPSNCTLKSTLLLNISHFVWKLTKNLEKVLLGGKWGASGHGALIDRAFFMSNQVGCIVYRTMLSNHMVRAEIRGVSSTMMVRRGCPQGGVLSPFLWNMVINSLLGRLNNESLGAQEFADDIAIVINGKFLITIYEFMQKALSIVVNF
jgi:hypothetical protein